MAWVFDNIRRWARLLLLAEILWRKKETIQMYFHRNWLDVTNKEDVKTYINKFYIFKKRTNGTK